MPGMPGMPGVLGMSDILGILGMSGMSVGTEPKEIGGMVNRQGDVWSELEGTWGMEKAVLAPPEKVPAPADKPLDRAASEVELVFVGPC